jgi:hypothetical protein
MGEPEEMGDPARRGGGRHGGRRARQQQKRPAPGAPGATADPAGATPRPSRLDGSAGGKAVAETAFDIWLSRSLHRMFDRYKDEDIPAEWLRLIEEDRTRRRGG